MIDRWIPRDESPLRPLASLLEQHEDAAYQRGRQDEREALRMAWRWVAGTALVVAGLAFWVAYVMDSSLPR